MKFLALVILAASVSWAARPFINEPDNGMMETFGNIQTTGELPSLESISGLTDFEWVARQYLPVQNYTYYRNAAGGEWSYRNNLEVFHRYTFKPRAMRDVRSLPNTMKTTILGHEFSAPFFIAPCARAAYGHPDAELNLVQAAGDEGILYIPSSSSSKSSKEIAAAKRPDQIMFQQFYLPTDDNLTWPALRDIEASGAKAIVLTVDAPTSGDRQRAYRQRGNIPGLTFNPVTWEKYDQLKQMTSLPIVLKGITTPEDALKAVSHNASAIVLSNHGGRQLDGSPSPLEIALAIHRAAPEVFEHTEVYADGGVRYGTDVLKLLALGVRAVGLGRPFMYANVYGVDGVRAALDILKRQILSDAANLGVTDVQKVDPALVDWESNNWMG